MSIPDDIRTAEELADAILKAAGSSLHHYSMPSTRASIIGAAANGLRAEREQCAKIAEEDRTPAYGAHKDAMEWLAETQRNNIAERIRAGRIR
jgi:hypothetical protein